MKQLYIFEPTMIIPSLGEDANLWVYSAPSDNEKTAIIERLDIDKHTIESAIDPEEVSRLEYAPELLTIIWKRPNNVSFEQQLRFDVSSVGVFLEKDSLTFVLGEGELSLSAKEFKNATSLRELVLKFLLGTIHHYNGHLKAIKHITKEIQSKLNVSMGNEYLLQMFSLSESLIYYLNALESNTTVLSRLRQNANKIGFSESEIEIIDDLIIEQQQCYGQTQIYSSVLSGLMDARGNIINNNMNVFLKNLTLINVVFLPLNLLASIGGMSEYSILTHNINPELSYTLFFMAMILLGWLTWKFILFRMDNKPFLFLKPRKKKLYS